MGDAHKIINFYESISSNPFSLAIVSPLFTLWLMAGWLIPIPLASSVALMSNSRTAQ
jgi:hypothetical protein